jgi:hypothetical protein|tara:strand:+ start:2971 stop:6438 length:3468 start_codon:yes stop_codon:yes gene_type:complete
MKSEPIQKLRIGNAYLLENTSDVVGEFIQIDGERLYKIRNYDLMESFFMSLVSHSDHWMFLSSTGGMSAGRKNEQSALFPYYTDDKITEGFDSTGSKSIFHVLKDGEKYLWEPFSDDLKGIWRINRNLYKNETGNLILFEEVNEDLNLTFHYSWQFSEKFGFVKKSHLENLSTDRITIRVLDGIQNILPYGISSNLQLERSNLTNAYKKNELEFATGLGLYLLSAMIVDKAEPSESLKATTVWSYGLESKVKLISSRQLDHFRLGQNIEPEQELRAWPGAYFLMEDIVLEAHGSKKWGVISELNQDHTAIVGLNYRLSNTKDELIAELAHDLKQGQRELRKLVGMSDGLQCTSDQSSVARHFSNVLFNIMRGGIFDNQYHIELKDLKGYLAQSNRIVSKIQSKFLSQLPDRISNHELIERVRGTNDLDLIRICVEYLPLFFSRRHGDPSRPWNKFSIETKNPNGSRKHYYEGNWRDIFQNWEALGRSFPRYIHSMITKFLNASTIDGYNPYKITSLGIDWEIIEPDDPWSFIGYWGDHQIIYLLKLLELAQAHNQQTLSELLVERIYVYANVPYRIKSYEEIVFNPQDTIHFDHLEAQVISERITLLGLDGKLVLDSKNTPIRCNLTEKLVITLLTKLTNFIPGAGIWLNTQRPEWNDANNALVGNGASMVTLNYMRRYVVFLMDLYQEQHHHEYEVNHFLKVLFDEINQILVTYEGLLKVALTNRNRKDIVDELGKSGASYRQAVYAQRDLRSSLIDRNDLMGFLGLTMKYLDHSILENRRADGLYHSYNLISMDSEEIKVDRLYEMLEGQVAVLSSGLLNPRESLELLEGLHKSSIYRQNQSSYMLYPDRLLPRFLDKNTIPRVFIDKSTLAKKLIRNGHLNLLLKDIEGNCHFAGTFKNVNDLKEALEQLKATEYGDLVAREYDSYVEVFESMFHHKAFTGRSGTFFGYEGLGSIYWHMVSKLLLATQEVLLSMPIITTQDRQTQKKLINHYYQIRAGIGIDKSPNQYGAFPTDPYSHTPAHKGVQQPGMTGQVKEDILNRWAELGIGIKKGILSFKPILLRQIEFLKNDEVFEYFDLTGNVQKLNLSQNELAFTYCQVPVIYKVASFSKIKVVLKGAVLDIEGSELNAALSTSIFSREGSIDHIVVGIGPK